MAGHANYTALLDANTLYPILTCDALLSLASTGLFAAKWSERIEKEWIRNLGEDRPELADKLLARRNHMRCAALDWEVPEPAIAALLPCLTLPAPNDAHVLAAAIAALKKMRQRRKRPPLSPEAFADAFERNGLPSVAARLLEASELI